MTYISSLYSHYFEILIINNNYYHRADNSLVTGIMQYVYGMWNYNQIIFCRHTFLDMMAWVFHYGKNEYEKFHLLNYNIQLL